ncbi:MAG: hypothetical protein ACK5JB_14635 [Pseudanabaena sp.]|nr:hypothetical protein [Pseudanabaena sp. M34BS1SP1A06MG]MCA6593127.1 hypothetical protein [Pseudanabaena sp. M38BS1SP1A06MG]MCA6598437.1 hypothetical protein [Pseudanabaena sp. M046S1SP1A06QC]MCA6600385.1 hypothetical protein [Pseudanabaena sp. M57BS1SP1A06MG]
MPSSVKVKQERKEYQRTSQQAFEQYRQTAEREMADLFLIQPTGDSVIIVNSQNFESSPHSARNGSLKVFKTRQ